MKIEDPLGRCDTILNPEDSNQLAIIDANGNDIVPCGDRNLLAATQPFCIMIGNGHRRDVVQRGRNRMQCFKSLGTIVDIIEKIQ